MKDKMIVIGYFIAAVMVFASWFTMFSGHDTSSVLSIRGIRALQYYTVDSNLFMGVAALVYIFSGKTPFSKVLVLCGTAVVCLTFLTVVCYLGPVMGYTRMFTGSNLYMHMIVPILSAALLICNAGSTGLPLSSACLAGLPTAVYAVFYIRNVIKNGSEKDWYGLAKGGPKTYLPICLGFIGITILIAAILWLISGGRSR
ncbi:MAG: hypothetical protein IJ899_17045 [Blautia sp.]|nr:hypothetical protein [Blautia sp.]